MRTVVRVGVLVGVGVLALAGCSRPAYQFVGDSKHDSVMRLPAGWTEVNADDVLKSSGDSASEETSWLTFFDASKQPSIDNVARQYADDPVLVAQTLQVPDDARSSLTGDFLRDVIVPVVPDAAEQQAAQQLVQQIEQEQAKEKAAAGASASASPGASPGATPATTPATSPSGSPGPTPTAAPGATPSAGAGAGASTGAATTDGTEATSGTTGDTYVTSLLLRYKTITTPTERGVHLVFSRTLLGHTEIYDKIAVTDPGLSRVHIVMVHCSQACFSDRGREIDQVVSSLRVKL
ncbi:hypothetical protein ACIB24_16060 [Spongisporangium articulatum]|uniref:Lipoprotein n=1 Tax=Spongisporangium articulatum TaxID=3362603 RepID=A0ABW8AQC8_9ACTN